MEPALFDKAGAEEMAAELNAAAPDGEQWRVEEAPLPCPCCGRELLVDDLDFLYPQNREWTSWRAGCNEHDFGCGYEVFGATADEVFAKWQDGAPNEGDAEDFGMAERYFHVRFGPEHALSLQLPLQLDAVSAVVTMNVTEPLGSTFELRGAFASQAALVRRGLRALRTAVGEHHKLEIVSYGGRVNQG